MPSVAFRSRRNATEGVPYSVTPTASKLNHAGFQRLIDRAAGLQGFSVNHFSFGGVYTIEYM